MNCLGPDHARTAPGWLRNVDHRDAGILVAADVHNFLLLVVAGDDIRWACYPGFQDLIVTDGGRP